MWNDDGGRYDMMDGGGGWMVVMAVVVMLVLLVALGLLAYLVLRGSGHSRQTTQPTSTTPDDALRLLDLRFARGELSAEEYTSVRSILKGG